MSCDNMPMTELSTPITRHLSNVYNALMGAEVNDRSFAESRHLVHDALVDAGSYFLRRPLRPLRALAWDACVELFREDFSSNASLFQNAYRRMNNVDNLLPSHFPTELRKIPVPYALGMELYRYSGLIDKAQPATANTVLPFVSAAYNVSQERDLLANFTRSVHIQVSQQNTF